MDKNQSKGRQSKENGLPAGRQNGHLHPLVAIGASAGGLEAMVTLLEHLPVDTGASYIILQHLSATHESILPELLERKTGMKVYKVEEGMHIEPNNVYVIPPNQYMSITDSRLTLSPRTRQTGGIHSIDHFLMALAPIYQTKAIAVILSGTASDGTAGVKAIKAEGGITFAQDDTARFQGMPHNAIDSGFIDFVLPPERIAVELLSIIQNLATNAPDPEDIARREEELRKIRAMLMNKHQVDFTLYKQTTIVRRIVRRIALNRLSNLEQYIGLLRENPNELDLLYKDLLINVTSFFREAAVYTALSKKIFPAVLQGRRSNEPIRIWVPACATGEEPCSIAICLFEFLKDKAISTPIQIFATDLSESAIAKARAGIYSQNSLVNVSPQRLRKFFVKAEGHYQIIKPIRDICIFATHNLLKDPPFSRMDIISCQNVLIYLETSAQKKILQAFHYALNPGKFLLLGKSETIGSSTELFEQVDKDLRIYSKKSVPDNMQFDFSMRGQAYHPMPNVRDERQLPAPHSKESDVEKEAERLMFSMYMPASVLVNKDLQILRFYGSTFPYLQPASGKASLHLLKMIRDELIFEMRNLIKQVKKDGKIARKEEIPLLDNGQFRNISMEILPIRSASQDACMLIVLQPSPTPASEMPQKRETGYRLDQKGRRILTLETELKEAREHVKSMTEDFEATREELQSANEEVLSSNEELQSINEELETSKEELQSTNEELITINEELQLRNTDLRESVDFTKAIVETIREPLIVLNSDMRILKGNRAFYYTFRLGQDDMEGHYLYEAASGLFDIPELRAQLKKTAILNTGYHEFGIQYDFAGIGHKVLQCAGMRLAGESGKRARMLLAIEDITERSRAEKDLRASEERLRLATEAANIFTWEVDMITREIIQSPRSRETLGFRLPNMADQWLTLVHPDDRDRVTDQYRGAILGAGELNEEFRFLDPATGRAIWVSTQGLLLKAARNLDPSRFLVITQNIDETKRRELNAVWLSEVNTDLIRLTDDSEIRSVVAVRINHFMETSRCLFSEFDEENGLLTVHHDSQGRNGQNLEGIYDIRTWIDETRWGTYFPDGPSAIGDVRKDPITIPFRQLMDRIGVRSLMQMTYRHRDKAIFMLTVCRNEPAEWRKEQRELLRDVAVRCWWRLEQAASGEKLRRNEERYRVALEAAELAAWDWNLSSDMVVWNRQYYLLLGLTPQQEERSSLDLLPFIHPEDKAMMEDRLQHVPVDGVLNEEFRIIRQKDQAIRWMTLFGRVVESEADRPLRMTGVIYDSTDRKSIERQKDEFISIASHELKTPVTSIRAYASLLRDIFIEAGDVRSADLVGRLKDQTDRLTSLVRDLLDVSGITEGQLHLNRTRFALNELILAITDDMRHALPNHQFVLELEAENTQLFADRERIGQVLMNIISNAVKYSPGAGKVIISSIREEAVLQFSVRDFGIGMTPEIQRRIFERFYRSLDPMGRTIPGLGLGLYITAEIVRQHHGTIAVTSEPGNGFLFIVRLPLSE